MNMWVEILVPASFFLAVVTGVGLTVYFRFKQRKLLADTTLKLLEDGKPVSPEVIRTLAQPVPQSQKDYRLGVILVGLGVAIYGFSVVVSLPTSGNTNLQDAIAGLAILPLVMGVTFLILSKLQPKL
jgi:hypothetical protein